MRQFDSIHPGKPRTLLPRFGSTPFLLLTICTLLLLALLSLETLEAAQTYRFSVPDLRMQVYIQPDASAQIIYDIGFANSPSASPIDIVDIGMPHSNYDISNMRASIDGVELTDIRVSEFVNPGVEVHLHNQAIPPGGTGTFAI